MASDSPRLLEENELEELVAMANSGDPEATQKLRDFFGEKCGPGTFRRLLFRAVAKNLGAYANWDHWNARADFERKEEGLRYENGTFAENLLAEAVAFAQCIDQTLHKRALDLDFECHPSTPESERAVRRRYLNAQGAHHAYVRVSRLHQSIADRREKAERHEQQKELTSLRIQLLQEQLRQLKESKTGDGEASAMERGASAPNPGPRGFRPASRKASTKTECEPFVPSPYDKPELYGFETFEEYVAALEDAERTKLLAELAYDDSHRGNWADPEMFFYNRFPTLFEARNTEPAVSYNVSPSSHLSEIHRPDPSDSSHPSDLPLPEIPEKHVKPISLEPAQPRQNVVDRLTRSIFQELQEAPTPKPRTRPRRR